MNVPNTRIALEWILTESDAPRDIKIAALAAAYDLQGSFRNVGGLNVSGDAVLKIREALSQEKKIRAVKELRTDTGCTLKEAKSIIDRVESGELTLP